jgi:hypothetical protein
MRVRDRARPEKRRHGAAAASTPDSVSGVDGGHVPGSPNPPRHHVLNVEVEVRLLVPELTGRIAQLVERLSYTQEVAGSIPALLTRRRIAQAAERLSDTQEAAGSTPAPPTSRDRSSAVERSSETRGGAGSTPAGHTFGFVAQQEEPPTLTRCGAGSTPAGAIPGRAAVGADPAASALRSGVVETGRRATVDREAQVRVLPPELVPPWSNGR